jgi:outer membrane protein assembly factor BamD
MNRFHITLFLIVVVGASLLQSGCGGTLKLGSLESDELFQLGIEQYEQHKYIRAVEIFQTIVYNFPGESVVDSAQYYLGLSNFGNKDYTIAEREFNRLMLNYPSSVYVVHAQFMRAVCFFEGTPKHYGLDQSDLDIAIRHFEDFIIDHPESELVPDTREYLLQARTRLAQKHYSNGMVYVHIRRRSAATTYFQKVIDDFTDTRYAAMASFQLADLAYNNKQFEKAHELFNNFLSVFPDHEWAEKATQRSEEAAFKNAEQAFESGQMAVARKLLESFLQDFPESKRLGKADKYLKQIGETPVDESTIEQASFGTDG